MLTASHHETDPAMKEKREDAGLRYVGNHLMKSSKPRENCVYDNATLVERANLGDVGIFWCPECEVCYEIPKEARAVA